MTPSEIALRRLVRQQLLGPKARTPQQVVERLVAVQAQDYYGAKWSVGLRCRGATDATVERAFDRGAILRTHLLRPTWHFVAPQDIRWLLALTGPRVQAANARLYRKLGMDAAAFRRSNAALARALEGGRYLTRDELAQALEQAGVRTSDRMRMSYFLMFAELEGLACSGPRRGKQFTYALLETRVPATKALTHDDALVELARRYFLTRGPATVQDFAKWSGLTVADARDGLEGAQGALVREVADGKTLWFAPSPRIPRRPASPVVHLLSIFDEYVCGYRDRSAMVSERNGARLLRMGNSLTGIVVVAGVIAGTWNRRMKGTVFEIRTEMFRRLTRAEDRAVKNAVRGFGRFVSSFSVAR
jgi:hypothetical protein